MTDRDEQIYQKIESIGIALQRGIKKNKAREFVMAEKYFRFAIAKIQETQDLLDERVHAKKDSKDK
jgi:CRISPR/Cas system CMR-associated protein Cmr3 (group 5 of RAMP superfamily)